jgi:CDP-paratose 2-epimerase
MCETVTLYRVQGYKLKQVRANIHSADLIKAFYAFFKLPRVAEVYDTGSDRYNNCSMLEAIDICQKIVGHELQGKYAEQNPISDHIWWISDNSKFAKHYLNWKLHYKGLQLLQEIYEFNKERWQKGQSND